MSVEAVEEAIGRAINAANEVTIYTHITSTAANLLNIYLTFFEDSKHSSKFSLHSLHLKKKRLSTLYSKLNNLITILESLTGNAWAQNSLEIPIDKPLNSIKNAMESIHEATKSLGFHVPEFQILDSDLADDFVALYGIFATHVNNEKVQQKLSEVEDFMLKHGISLPGQKLKMSLDDFFSDIGKFKLTHDLIQKGKLVASRPEGDFYNGIYKKDDEEKKITIMEIPEYSFHLENYQREVASLSSISHPNIIEFIGASSTSPYWIVTARHGHTLRYYLQHQKNKKWHTKSQNHSGKSENSGKKHIKFMPEGLLPPEYPHASVFIMDESDSEQNMFKKELDERAKKEKQDQSNENEVEADKSKQSPETHQKEDTNEVNQGTEQSETKADSSSSESHTLDSQSDKTSEKHHKKKELTGAIKTQIAYKVAEAMAYVHTKNIIHRDLSTNSVVLDKSLNPFIVNFSASRFVPEDESLLLTVGVGHEIAKAPELTSDSRYGLEVDVFSYGMLLYEMLTGEIPFESLNGNEVQAAILSARRPNIPEDTPQLLADLITKCWSPLPKDRPTFIEIVNTMTRNQIVFPDSDPQEVASFYSSVSVKSSDVQCSVDLMQQICQDINDVIVFKHEVTRIRALLSGYILDLRESKAAHEEIDSIELSVDINNLMTELSKLSLTIKNITSPIWEQNALNIPATRPIDDILYCLDSLYVPLAQLGLTVEKYKPNKIDLQLDYRLLYSIFKNNDVGDISSVKARIKEVEDFMKKHDITVVPTQQEIDERISAVFKTYENYLVDHSQFEKLREIGDGATSNVYLGIDKSTNEKVAIKEFNDDYLRAENCGFYLHREIAALATLHHEYLAKFIGTTKVTPIWVISEYIPNGDLETFIEKGQLTPIQKTTIMYEVAEGMAYLHSMKMIHRDLKSKNILLDANYEPKIVDFGFARPISYTMSVCVGTPIYMAPEVIQSSYYDYKADVFSFALMISEMITGFKPFTQFCSDPLTIQQSILDGIRPVFDDELGVSQDMKDLLENMWAADYNDRPDFDTVLDTMREKKIAFPGASDEEINSFYEIKEEKLLRTRKARPSRRMSLFNIEKIKP